jgi:hypothetical protein
VWFSDGVIVVGCVVDVVNQHHQRGQKKIRQPYRSYFRPPIGGANRLRFSGGEGLLSLASADMGWQH